ncbi:ABC transporter permease [Arthrobacter psychrochitiniphilus]|uniref:ABC transporter permease n=1 Tax=Arthrobacter psychrochitiniphilus TaxID=291045 RepID=A0A2V3DU47_9MICC|nr:ABC transporter permease [Arthrobacter psychrochitiniphilus]NYG15570.1 osmoprotectant transport system permease protein [Arthrobacter psychrochitiniphilus]PXA66937.1 ABC transporter permease [Arthrobacter psychrochitiniphilus]
MSATAMLLPATKYTASGAFAQGWQWLTDPVNWQGPMGVPTRVLEQLGYTGLTLVISLVIAVPVGLYVGHTGRGRAIIIALAGMLRALPTLGVMTLFALIATSTLSLMPAIWSLVLLAVPPIVSATYAGISSVERDLVDAARSMGMTEPQILFGVEVPNGLIVMLGGFRSAVLQVVSTVAVVALLGLGGLGRYIIDGLAVQDYGQVLGGAVVIAGLAIALDGLLVLAQRLIVSPGLQRSAAPTQVSAPQAQLAEPAPTR